MKVKGCLFFQILVCLYKTGPGESSLIASAITNKSGERRTSANKESTKSDPLLTTLHRPSSGEALYWSAIKGHNLCGREIKSSKKSASLT